MNEEIIQNFESEKYGLSLSGGGLRASFFHVGVLCQLAERALLKKMEIISTVSGGSITGVLYYLELMNLLEYKEDHEIKNEDYIKIVDKVLKILMNAAKKNILLKSLGNINLISKAYNNSIFREAFKDSPKFQNKNLLDISDLEIQPKDGLKENEKRENKIPKLFINTTMLNTGNQCFFCHDYFYQYTPNKKEENKFNPYIQKVDYKTLTNEKLSLHKVVAASTCVPGIFKPISIKSNTLTKEKLFFVDGGNTDNLGINALKFNKCTHFFISDGSKQIDYHEKPSKKIHKVVFRSNDILMENIKREQINSLSQEIIQYYFHLRNELFIPAHQLTFTTRKSKYLIPDLKIEFFPFIIRIKEKIKNPIVKKTPLQKYEEFLDNKGYVRITKYDVEKRVQFLLSNVRTNLDYFHEKESKALMAVGYLIAKKKLNSAVDTYNWEFKDVQSLLHGSKHDKESVELVELLMWSSNRFYTPTFLRSTYKYFRNLRKKK